MKMTMKKKVKKPSTKVKAGFDHKCDWREAAVKLARCVVATLQADGKIGVGSGMMMKRVEGKMIVERWDKDFHEALAFIGIKLVDKPAHSAVGAGKGGAGKRKARPVTEDLTK